MVGRGDAPQEGLGRAGRHARTVNDDDTREALAKLDLPQREIGRWLEDDIAFCREHGGERRYAELLAILERFRAAQLEREQGE